MRNRRTEPTATDHALLNIVTPIGLTFRRNSLMIGDCMSRVYAVMKYPPTVSMGWLSNVSNMPATIMSQTFIPVDNGLLVESIAKNIMQNLSIAQSTSDPLEQMRAEKGAEDGEQILKQIDLQGEIVGYMVNLVMPLAADEEGLAAIGSTVESAFAGLKCKLRVLANLQKESFQTLSPHYLPQEKICDCAKRLVPLSTFVGGLSFASRGYNDGVGSWVANDNAGGMVILDLWRRAGDRTNSNMVVLGASGQGKSTALKNIIISEYILGTKIIIIDPERECKELVDNLGGDWINCGGTRRQYNEENVKESKDSKAGKQADLKSDGMINPLHITYNPSDEEDESDGMGDLAKHMKSLEIFFSLYMKSISEIQSALLKKTLIELYENSNIDWNTSVKHLSPEDFPQISDLYSLISEKATGKTNKADYEVLLALLNDMANGSDRFYWNGKTTIHAKSQVICLDTHDLQNTSDRIKRAQYFNILNWAWEQMSRDRTEKVLLIADEAYLMIDPQVPQSLVFLRNIAKRARKYEAGIAIVSHSVTDFLHESVKNYAQPLLDMPTYKLMFGCDGKDLEELSTLYNFTDAEYEKTKAKMQKKALMMIGAKRIPVEIKIPQYRLDIIGSGGGR